MTNLVFRGFVLVVFVIGQCSGIDPGSKESCFCKLQGEVDDCSCKVQNVDSFNNQQIYPILQSLVTKNYFRYFKVNLNRGCPFWSDDSRCAIRDCAVNKCNENEVPEGLKGKDNDSNQSQDSNKYSKVSQETDNCEENTKLGHLNTTISEKTKEVIKNWTAHDDAENTFCHLDDESSSDLAYVDLQLNPERYTGYAGGSAHRIWKSIYEENCFKSSETVSNYGSKGRPTEGMCLEKRVFYRMVSGLHTSINVHLTAKCLLPAKNGYGVGTWGPNYNEFQKRFDPKRSNGRGPQFLKNLYFAYLVELRALAKAAPYLEQGNYFTGSQEEDSDVKKAVSSLLKVVESFPDEHFDESRLFQGDQNQAQNLKKEFRSHFLNISRIMDCVGCDKCRLWGKLQVQGMGTALKILFSGDTIGPKSTVSRKGKFNLKRTEIVSLINAFARLSESIKEIDLFRKMVR